MSTINEITSMLTDVAKGMKSANAALEKARERRTGTYNGAVAVAVQASSADQLEKAFDKLFAAIRTDGKLAVSVGGKKRKKPTKAGDKYTVPTGLQSAKSVVLGAMRLGVELTDDGGEPLSFGAIRTAKSEAEADAKAESASPDDVARAHAAEVTTAILEGLSEFGGKGLTDIVELLETIRDRVTEANTEAEALTELAEAA